MESYDKVDVFQHTLVKYHWCCCIVMNTYINIHAYLSFIHSSIYTVIHIVPFAVTPQRRRWCWWWWRWWCCIPWVTLYLYLLWHLWLLLKENKHLKNIICLKKIYSIIHANMYIFMRTAFFYTKIYNFKLFFLGRPLKNQ